ncbi:lysosomal-trafficking regulator-like [Ostrinia furnacalis]|uniref:lysosomal-trafficking regulator-like n=1 Tax=Ostrinia furnacalis TaxID=93504 RepID=UPI0010393646|nr:lysosomal-trafficking regulator-like [Ostrinia furnacalis]
MAAVSGSSSGTRARWWSGGGAEWAALLQEAVWWGGAPGSGARELQPRLLRRLYRASPQALQALTPQEPGASRQTICDIHYQLTFVEQTESDEEVRIACRSAQAALFNAQLAQLEERLADAAPHNKYATYFSTVLSSAMSVGGEARVDRAELAARHVATVTRALAFLQSHSPRDPLPPAHAALYDRLLATLLIGSVLSRPFNTGSSSGTRARWWSGGGAEWAALLQEAVWWGGAPGSGARELQPRLLRRLYRASPQALQALTPQEPGASRQEAVWWGGAPGSGARELQPRLLRRLYRASPQALQALTPQEPGASRQEAVWWGGAPGSGARELQPRLLRRLYRASPQALQALTPQEPGASRQLAVYLLLILQNQHLQAEAGTPGVELAITDWARGWAVSTQAALPARLSSDSLAAEGAALLARDLARWAAARARQQPAIARAVFRKQAVCARLAEGAMAVTRAAVEAQNAERKGFMQHLRRRHAARHAAATRWARLVRDYTHDRAVFHEPRSWPASWQLDPTEGPGRVRVRLRRAHLRIHKRFLQPAQQYKPDLAKRPPPLRSVLGRSATERDGLAARLQLNECVACMARVTHVTHDSETCGELLLTDRSIHFVPEDSGSDDESWEPWAPGRAQCWALGSVTAVGTRRWCLQERAVELFLASGHAQLLAFDSEAERANFLKALKNCHLPNKQEEDTLAEAMNQWRNGSITNWEYLMRLNGLAGRSYNDLMQYPVLPFVLADYTSRVLDLTAPETFRDLTKPMAVQRKSREQHYINTYNDLKAARREGCSPVVARQPHHYASLYSNSGGVLHYLVRLPPFTELFLNYQDNNFDMPDRTFHSLATTWRLITNDSPTDVKELIPELFYLPELFHNNEGLELGVRQCGLGVDDVEVPAWAAEARAFVLLHRQALEAPHVTERLPHWLDLVLGYKQTGQAAVDALNVFPACTYYGFDPAALEDEVDRTAAAAMVRTYGQAPRQLLRQPHPHAAHELTRAAPHRQLEAWGGAIGVRWGRYCGSPELPDPVVVARRAGAASVVPLPAPRLAAALPQATALLALPGDASSNSAGGGAWGVVSWGHWDGIVRLRQRRDAPPDLLLQVPPLDQITLMTSSTSASCPVIVGYASGRVEAWRVSVVRGAPPRLRARALLAHRAPLAAAHACPPAATLATADTHGVILLWDLAELTYIRTLPNRDMLPVTHLAISPTLSDVASVHDTARSPDSPDAREQPPGQDGDADSYERDATDKYQSLIRVHTVNGRFVGSVRVTERVTCVCYSAAAEGASVNVVAAGLAGGGAALYSSWDLRPVARLPPALAGPARPTPLCSLAYSSDSMALFGCYADGWAVAWEAGGAGAGRSARLLPAHALL